MPDLRVVPVGALVLHEEPDDRRTQLLRQRLAVEQIVKNPPVVTPIRGERFVVLDGANRTSALSALGVRHAVVQVVDYKSVELSTWHHLVSGMPTVDLVAHASAVPDVKAVRLEAADARRRLADGRIMAYIVTPDGAVTGLAGGTELISKVERLKAAVAVYKGRADIFRVQSSKIEPLLELYSEVAGLVVFPPYTTKDIRSLAMKDVKLPTGITRHVIPRRALRLNTPLSLLWTDTPLGEKNRWLSEWTRHKLQSREIRIYEESTVLYDE